MKLSYTWTTSAALMALVGLAPVASADPPQPPKEAFTACANLKAGDACTVTFGPNTIDGTCAATPDNQLACRPDGPPPGPPKADPTEDEP